MCRVLTTVRCYRFRSVAERGLVALRIRALRWFNALAVINRSLTGLVYHSIPSTTESPTCTRTGSGFGNTVHMAYYAVYRGDWCSVIENRSVRGQDNTLHFRTVRTGLRLRLHTESFREFKNQHSTSLAGKSERRGSESVIRPTRQLISERTS